MRVAHNAEKFESEGAPVPTIVKGGKLEEGDRPSAGAARGAEVTYGTDLLNLVVSEGHLSKWTGNREVRQYLALNHKKAPESFEGLPVTTSREPATILARKNLTLEGNALDGAEGGRVEF